MSITSRNLLIRQLKAYTSPFQEELTYSRQFLQLLESPNCYWRNHLPGHITGSSWIVNPKKERVLLLHHAKLNKWLQPGGHADGDENILRVATREAQEETGLKNLDLLHNGIFDIDIHTIPPRGDFPEHLHYDIRFVFSANDDEPLVPSEESHQVVWTSLEDLARQTEGDKSMLRMAEKTMRYRELINNIPKAITTIQNL